MKAAEEKKTFWGRVKSLFWKILNTIKSWFSSNDASKVSSAPYDGPVYDPKAVEECLAKRKAKDANQQTPKQPEGNGPDEEVSTPSPNKLDDKSKLTQEAEKGGNDNEKPGEAFSESKGDQEQKHGEKPQEGHVGYINITDHGLQFIVHKNYEPLVKKTIRDGRYEIYAKIGGKTHGITGSFSPANMSGEYILFSSCSVILEGSITEVNPKDLLDLNGGAELKITDISDKQFPEAEIHAPTVSGEAQLTDPKPVGVVNGQKK